MRGVWEIIRRNEEGESVVVVPSVSLDRVGERSGSLQQAQRHPQSESDHSQRHRHDQRLAEPRSEVAPWPHVHPAHAHDCEDPVGFQTSATVVDLGFYAARSYSLRRPPGTGRRLTRTWERSATG